VIIIQVQYDNMYYYDVVGYSSSDVMSGALWVKRPTSVLQMYVRRFNIVSKRRVILPNSTV